MASKSSKYSAEDIEKLSDIAHLRTRAGMYIPDTSTAGVMHILWEVIDNSVDEYMAGYCSEIRVGINTRKNVAVVEDNGRGIPVEVHAQTGRPTVVSVLTELHMGGKFGKQAYAISGGLHGIGIKATCALSDRIQVQVTRDRKVYRVGFSRGEVVKPLKKVGKARKGKSGTKTRFHPDPEMFGKAKFDPKRLEQRLEAIAFLCPRLRVLMRVNGKVRDLTSHDGLKGFLKSKTADEDPAFDAPLSFSVEKDDGEGMDVVVWWTDGDGEQWHTYCNMIPVPDGGTHVTGAKSAITRELRRFCDKKNVVGDDFRDGLRVAFHIRLKEPQFEGQTKNRLNNVECTQMANRLFSKKLRLFFNRNNDIARKLVARAEEMAKARAAYKASRRIGTQTAYAKEGNSRRGLPDKLTAALRCKKKDRELFLVEGDSAGGSAVQGRNGQFQEVLPLRGKIPNPSSIEDPVKLAKFFENDDIDNIVRSIGAGHDVDHHHESCDPSKARVGGKVILLMDADIDGGHIICLLLAFFLRFMLPMIEEGRIWIAQPPLFVAKWSSGRVFGDSVEQVMDKAKVKGIRKPHVSRFKGLGEMTPEQLRTTGMSPDTRRLIRVSGDRQSVELVCRLMGSDVTLRKQVLGLID